MLLISKILLLIFISLCGTIADKEILPENCHCRDWYGACRQQGDSWTDDGIWSYQCSVSDGADATFIGCLTRVGKNGQERVIPVGRNETFDEFWYSCEASELRQKFEQEPRCTINSTLLQHVGETFRDNVFQWICLDTGRWVTGCFYQSETKDWELLKIGEVGYNGLIRHTCDRYKDNPGLVQYHAEIRDDIPYKNPSNKGQNKNFPDLVDNRLKNEPTPWTHKNAVLFIAENDVSNVKVRYLPPSRNIQAPRGFGN